MNSDIEKIRKGWYECGRKVSECQKHGVLRCKILIPPTETYCQGCQYQLETEARKKEEQLKNEAWIKAQEKAQNWWKSLSLSEKQEQIKLLEENLKNEKPGKIDIITWGNIKSGQSETYKNGKFSTTDIEQVPTKLVEKFIDHSNIPPSCQTPNLNSFRFLQLNSSSRPSNNQFLNLNQSNQTTPNPQNLNTSRTVSSTENLSFDNSRTFSETLNNQNQSYNQKKAENENIPPTEKSESQNPLPTSTALKNVVDTSQVKKDQGLTKNPLLISLFLLSLFGIIIFSLWKKNKRPKS